LGERESNTSLRCGKMGESVALDFGSLAPQAVLAGLDNGHARSAGMP
jgi:hypothetical protein